MKKKTTAKPPDRTDYPDITLRFSFKDFIEREMD